MGAGSQQHRRINDMVNVRAEVVQHNGEAGVSYRVARVSIDNTARLNCVSRQMAQALVANLKDLAAHDDLRAVIVTGAGDRAFIGGADLKQLGGFDHDGARAFITSLHEACRAIRNFPVPVIARVNGFCLGAGLEIAASCDVRIAQRSAVFGMPEVHMGLPSVIEAALLPGLIGWGKTREILLTGETFDAAQALDMRFIQHMVDDAAALNAKVDEIVSAICRAAPAAIRAQKALMNRWERVSVEEGILAGIDALAEAYNTGEPQARIAAFFEAKDRAKK